MLDITILNVVYYKIYSLFAIVLLFFTIVIYICLYHYKISTQQPITREPSVIKPNTQ